MFVVNSHCIEHACENINSDSNRLYRIKHTLFIFLEIFIVGQR